MSESIVTVQTIYEHSCCSTYCSGFAESSSRRTGPLHVVSQVDVDDGGALDGGHVIHGGDLHSRVQGLLVLLQDASVVWYLTVNTTINTNKLNGILG